MGIFSRTRDILASNIGQLLDRAEDPAATIRAVIAEMEETLVDVRAAAARTIADLKEVERSSARLLEAAADWEEKAALALSKGREDLARAALVEKRKAEAAAAQLREERALLAEQLSGYEEDLGRLEAKLNDARARQAALLARIAHAGARARARAMTRGQRVAEAFTLLDVMEQKADLAEGELEAWAARDPQGRLADTLSDLGASDAVSAELEALKARLGRSKP